jgi:hypothetical protein
LLPAETRGASQSAIWWGGLRVVPPPPAPLAYRGCREQQHADNCPGGCAAAAGRAGSRRKCLPNGRESDADRDRRQDRETDIVSGAESVEGGVDRRNHEARGGNQQEAGRELASGSPRDDYPRGDRQPHDDGPDRIDPDIRPDVAALDRPNGVRRKDDGGLRPDDRPPPAGDRGGHEDVGEGQLRQHARRDQADCGDRQGTEEQDRLLDQDRQSEDASGDCPPAHGWLLDGDQHPDHPRRLWEVDPHRRQEAPDQWHREKADRRARPSHRATDQPTEPDGAEEPGNRQGSGNDMAPGQRVPERLPDAGEGDPVDRRPKQKEVSVRRDRSMSGECREPDEEISGVVWGNRGPTE